MRKQEIESAVHNIADRVKRGERIEDDRFELKLQWSTDWNDVARQIAAHANAAHSDRFMWIIGMKDSNGGTIATPESQPEFSEWWAQVEPEFEGKVAPAPECLNIPIESETVTAMRFETDRAPYVVKNSNFGGGGKVKWEVP